MAIFLRLLILSGLLISGVAHAADSKPARASTAAPSAKLDQELVKRFYVEGDFDPAIGILEDFQKASSKWTREESLMVYKYLGVMYSADQSSREKGKSYFYKLLEVDREAKILDMYVSIVVQEIFKGTLEELMGYAQPSSGGAPVSALPAGPSDKGTTGSSPKDPAVRKEKSHAVYWWLGGIGLAAGIAGGYYAYESSQGTSDDVLIPVKPDPE